MSTDDIGQIRQLIASGADARARRALARLVHMDPENVQAWELLATLCDDSAQQADCYRQILRVDPENQRALARLEALQDQAAPSPGAPSDGETALLRCRHCGGHVVTSTESSSTFQVEKGGCLSRLLQLLGIQISAGDQ